MQSDSYSFQLTPKILISCTLRSAHLQLRSAFGTSHSSTTSRQNAILEIQIGERLLGFGEIGLPPKKPLCYTANFDDVKSYFNNYITKLDILMKEQQSLFQEDTNTPFFYDPFQNIPEPYFNTIRNQTHEKEPVEVQIIRLLFRALDQNEMSLNPNQYTFALTAQSGIESALFDLWGKFLKTPIFALINSDQVNQKQDESFVYLNKPGFYTTGLDQVTTMIQTSTFGRQHTPYLKIKLDGDKERGFTIMNALYDAFKGFDIEKKWSIDANSGFTPELSLEYLEILSKDPLNKVVYMLEQPFPVELGKVDNFPQEELAKWEKVKAEYEKVGIWVIADESVSTKKDVEKLHPYVHGVNIKLEKAGGIRGAVQIVDEAKKRNMKIWVGMMVASRLSSTIAAHLLPFTDYGGDLDGALLVTEDSQDFIGGFEWEPIESGNRFGLVRFTKNDINQGGVGVNKK